MLTVMDYVDNAGRLVFSAGQKISCADGLDPDGLASDETEAEEKLRTIAKLRLAESREAKNQAEYDKLMFDYHRSMSLAFAFPYTRAEAAGV